MLVTIIDEQGNIDGHAEENANMEESFNTGVDPNQDESAHEQHEADKEFEKEKDPK